MTTVDCPSSQTMSISKLSCALTVVALASTSGLPNLGSCR